MLHKLGTSKPGIRTSLIEGFRSHLDTWQNMIKGVDKLCDVDFLQSPPAGLMTGTTKESSLQKPVPPPRRPLSCVQPVRQASTPPPPPPRVPARQRRSKRRSRVDISYEVHCMKYNLSWYHAWEKCGIWEPHSGKMLLFEGNVAFWKKYLQFWGEIHHFEWYFCILSGNCYCIPGTLCTLHLWSIGMMSCIIAWCRPISLWFSVSLQFLLLASRVTDLCTENFYHVLKNNLVYKA